MTTHIPVGYLERDYLADPYLAMMWAGDGIQFTATIDKERAAAAQFKGMLAHLKGSAAQVLGKINAKKGEGFQFEATITTANGSSCQTLINIDTNHGTGTQFTGQVGEYHSAPTQTAFLIQNGTIGIAAQFLPIIEETKQGNASQFEGMVGNNPGNGVQFRADLTDQGVGATQFFAYPHDIPGPLASEFTGEVIGTKQGGGVQFLSNPVTHALIDYLVADYATDPYGYAAAYIHAHLSTEYTATLIKGASFGAEYLGKIDAKKTLGGQFLSRIFEHPQSLGVQFKSIIGFGLPTQFRSVLYNTTNLRIMVNFPSRGTTGLNWTANTTATGDFSPNNLNTDIVEQVWRSGSTVSGIQIVCDTEIPQGVFLDTLAILNHNLTQSANVQLIGSNSPTFATVGVVVPLTISRTNTFYISPELPINGYRYWKITIDDVTNTSGYLQIGTIVFGDSIIMSGECFVNPIQMKQTHYSDKIYTEGFTNASNDRGVKRKIGLDFRSLNFSGGNYLKLQEVFDIARTNLKGLWIPTPGYPSRYAAFGKLTDLPQETHTDNGESADYVDLSVEVDESL
jgi:hypothetical protein